MPISEGNTEVTMEHDGRFRGAGGTATKLSAAFVDLPSGIASLEHPAPRHSLPSLFRRPCVRLPRFDPSRSLAEWVVSDVAGRVKQDEHAISALLP